MRLAVSALCVIAALVILTPLLRPEAEAAPAITAADRARGLTFDAGVAPADRQWISAALVKVRPEAARLIAEVDGLTHGQDVPRTRWLGDGLGRADRA